MTSVLINPLDEILTHYFDNEDIKKVTSIKTGLINQSYKIELPQKVYLLQKINDGVFLDVDGLMKNIDRVTQTLKSSFANTQYETLELIKTKDDLVYVKNQSGYWRVYRFKDHLRGFETPKSIEMVYEAGRAFAQFTKSLSAIKPEELAVSIPNFHSLRYRTKQLNEALITSKINTNDVLNLIDEMNSLSKSLLRLEDAYDSGDLPLRITHNDTKFNNLLFDDAGIAHCVVDLDTVMPGIIHFDIGDCMRTLVPETEEDEPNLEKVKLRRDYYQEFITGYTEGNWLTTKEMIYLNLASPYMSLIMAVRFLTDYLNSNRYYSIDYPEHNLIRAKNQLEVTRQFMAWV